MFLEIFFCITVLSFPLMIYSYYILYKKNYKEKEKSIILDLTLFITLFLIINVLNYYNNEMYYIFCIIPIFLSYIYRRKVCIFLISIIVGFYIYNVIDVSIVFIIIINILYFFTYLFYMRTNKTVDFLIGVFYLCTVIILSLQLIIKNELDVNHIILFVLFLFILKLLLIAHRKTNEIVNIYMTLNDLEQEKKLKVSLFKITHEIKNPLTVVSGYLQMYDEKNIKKNNKYIKIINSEVKRVLNLLDDFSEFTKIKVIKKEEILNNLIEEVKETIIPLAKKKKISISFEIENDVVINIDRDRMKQVLINIIKNGIEACNNCGKMFLTIYKDEESVYIYIKDNGIGMDKDTMDNILKPFYTTKCNGTGLGVSLSNEIILAHSGVLEFSSIKNRGSVFKIILPL